MFASNMPIKNLLIKVTSKATAGVQLKKGNPSHRILGWHLGDPETKIQVNPLNFHTLSICLKRTHLRKNELGFSASKILQTFHAR